MKIIVFFQEIVSSRDSPQVQNENKTKQNKTKQKRKQKQKFISVYYLGEDIFSLLKKDLPAIFISP